MEGASPAREERRGNRRLPLLLALLGAAVAALLLSSCGAGSTGISSISVDSPTGVAVGKGATWVTSFNKGEVVKIDAAGETEVMPAGPHPTQIIVRDNAIWVATEDREQMLTQINPLSREVTQTIPYIKGCECSVDQFGFRWDALWASSGDQHVVKMFDYLAGSRLGYGYHPGNGFKGPMVLLEHVLWAVENSDGDPPVSGVIRINLNEGATRIIPVRKGSDFTQLAYGNGIVWISDSKRSVVAAYNPEREEVVADIPVATAASGDLLAADDELVLAWDPESGELTEIDAKTMKVVGTREPPDYEPGKAAAANPGGLVLDDKTAWLTYPTGDIVYKIEY